jgi:hypothetical protein
VPAIDLHAIRDEELGERVGIGKVAEIKIYNTDHENIPGSGPNGIILC